MICYLRNMLARCILKSAMWLSGKIAVKEKTHDRR